jgi:hypothetical protein
LSLVSAAARSPQRASRLGGRLSVGLLTVDEVGLMERDATPVGQISPVGIAVAQRDATEAQISYADSNNVDEPFAPHGMYVKQNGGTGLFANSTL